MDHVSADCPEWKKPTTTALFLGSANSGLGFHHVDVEAREGRFRHWKGFDNYGVFVIEEGEMNEEGIVENLKEQVDKEWPWQVIKLEEYNYLIKFPPHKRVDSNVTNVTYFYLKGGGGAGVSQSLEW